MIYFSIFCLLIFFSFFSLKPNKVSHFIFLTFILFLLFFVGFRYEIGCDWDNYVSMFNTINKNLYSTDFGYSIINILAYKMDFDIVFVNFLCAILFFYCVFFFLSKMNYPLVGLIILFPYAIVVVSMGYTRQSVAIGFAMIAIYYIVYRFNSLKFILFLFLAFLFHKSSIFLILFLPFLYLKKMKLKSIYFYIFIGLSLLIIIYIFKKYYLHIQTIYLSNMVFSAGVLPRLIIHLLPITIYFIYKKRYANLNIDFLNFASLFILFSIPISLFYSTIADRLNLYFIVFDIIVLDRFIYCLKFKSKIIFLFFIIVINFLMLYVWYNHSFYADACWKPYQNYLQEML